VEGTAMPHRIQISERRDPAALFQPINSPNQHPTVMKATASILSVAATVAVCVLSLAALANSPRSSPTPSLSPSQLIERGDYLVNRVGMCIDCHTPRDATGNFVAGKHLAGAPLGFAPTVPMPWMPAAPRIAGLPAGFSRSDTVHFLMTGERPNGRSAPLPPMPSFRFERGDAEAITAYLESLPVTSPGN
jgi:mono/diheme cytochrome c family protein